MLIPPDLEAFIEESWRNPKVCSLQSLKGIFQLDELNIRRPLQNPNRSR